MDEVLLAFDAIQSGISIELLDFELDDSKKNDPLYLVNNRLQINMLNAQAKLQKYRELLKAPVYYAAVVLVPWYKWFALEETLDTAELDTARKAVKLLWDTYSKLDLAIKVPQLPQSVSNNVGIASISGK